MTGFLATLVARAAGEPAPLQPRRAQRFEPSSLGGDWTGDLPHVVEPAHDPGPATAADDRPESARTLPQPRLPDAAPGTTPATERSIARGSDADRLAPDDVARARAAARAAAVRAASAVSDGTVTAARADRDRDRAPFPPESTNLQPRTPEVPQRPAPDPTTVAGSPSPEDERRESRRAPSDEVATPLPPAPVPVIEATSRAPEPPPSRPGHVAAAARAPSTRTRPAPPTGPPINLAELLRNEVFAALAERGVVRRDERPVLDASRSTRPPPRGTARLWADGVQVEQPSAGAAPGTDGVTVHIDRVSVSRAAEKTPRRAARAPTRRVTVDHAAYLARRRERG